MIFLTRLCKGLWHIETKNKQERRENEREEGRAVMEAHVCQVVSDVLQGSMGALMSET